MSGSLDVNRKVSPGCVKLVCEASASPQTHPAPEKTLALLRKQFDEAVVVVLADESYDFERKLVAVSVIEVWKGPQSLVGKTMNTALKAPTAKHANEKGEFRVLRFMPMTPHLDTVFFAYFDDNVLRMNPAFTAEALRRALQAGLTAQM